MWKDEPIEEVILITYCVRTGEEDAKNIGKEYCILWCRNLRMKRI